MAAEQYDIHYILATQRNRHPLLFLDRLERLDPGKSLVATKNFTYNEWFFPAHFDDEAIVPGFVLTESLAQAFILTFLCLEGNEGQKTNLHEVIEAKFLKKVIPGDTLTIHSELESFRFGLATGSSKGYIEDQLVCQASFRVVLPSAALEVKKKKLG